MNSKLKKRIGPPVLVIVCDAGGAEVIAAYVKKHAQEWDFHSYVAGPAVRVYRRLGLPFRRVRDSRTMIARIVREHTGARYALLGLPGLLTKIELRSLMEAKRIGLRTIVYVDSWAKYRESFGYPKSGWRNKLPDEIWAGDRYALSIVKRDFKHIAVRFEPNQYFIDIKERYRRLRLSLPSPASVLFVSSVQFRTKRVLSFLLSSLACAEGEKKRVRIRFHPADDRTRYDALIRQYRGKVHVEKSAERDIVDDLLRATIVVGMETVALAAAVQCGIKTVSLLPPKEKQVLPFREIIRVRLPATKRDITRLI